MHAWKQLNGFDDIDFTHQSRDLADFHHLKFLDAHGEFADVGIFLLTCHHDIVEHLSFDFHIDIQALARVVNNDFFFNQRFQGYTNVKYDINRFSFAWRSRYQMTYRPEKKEEKQWVNYWRNKFSFSAKIPKVPLYSSLAAELFYRTNNYKGNYITKLRYEGALKYEFDKKNSLKLYYQYDDPVNVKKLKNVSNLGLSYQFSF